MKELLRVARDSIEAHLAGQRLKPLLPRLENEAESAQGLFVTLWEKGPNGEKELRGCIGRHVRLFSSVAEEVADCAMISATEDPRFAPVGTDELPQLLIEVSLLEKPERVQNPTTELNPQTYGIQVYSKDRRRQATLLPEIDGIDTVEKQLAAIRRKAGIGPNEPVEIFRFRVKKIQEE